MALDPYTLPESPGVYRIVNAITGECYVGASGNVRKRCHSHLSLLCLGNHYPKEMQRSYAQHGPDAFSFELLDRCEVPELSIREEAWVKELSPVFNTRKKCTVFRPGFGIDPGKTRRRRPPEKKRPRVPRQTVSRLSHEARHERRKEMANAIAAGTPTRDVAAQFQVTEQTVWKAAKEYGLSPVRVKKAIRDRAIISMWEDKKATGDEIAETLNVSAYTVWDAFRRSGVQRRRGVRKGSYHDSSSRFVPRETWEQVDWSKTDRAIADELLVSFQRVSQVRHKLGKVRKQLLVAS